MSRIIEDNIMYLNEWSLHNNLIDSALKIEGNYLIYENDKIDISNFYFPELLFNKNFRDDIKNKLTSKDIFNIVKVYVTTDKLNNEKDLNKNKINEFGRVITNVY